MILSSDVENLQYADDGRLTLALNLQAEVCAHGALSLLTQSRCSIELPSRSGVDGSAVVSLEEGSRRIAERFLRPSREAEAGADDDEIRCEAAG